MCVNNVLLNVFKLLVGLNCYEVYSTLHGYDKFETLVIIMVFWLPEP